MEFHFAPLNNSNWKQFEELFGKNGACGGCWCMAWRLPNAVFNNMKGEGNKKAFKMLLKKSSPGVVAFDGEQAVGWCAVAPREEYIKLENSRVLKPVDERKVWSVSCFFIKKEYRKKGLSTLLLKATAGFAFDKGATIVEGYPIAQKAGSKMPDVFAWTGLLPTFIKAGFKEAGRRSETRPIMRLEKNKK